MKMAIYKANAAKLSHAKDVSKLVYSDEPVSNIFIPEGYISAREVAFTLSHNTIHLPNETASENYADNKSTPPDVTREPTTKGHAFSGFSSFVIKKKAPFFGQMPKDDEGKKLTRKKRQHNTPLTTAAAGINLVTVIIEHGVSLLRIIISIIAIIIIAVGILAIIDPVSEKWFIGQIKDYLGNIFGIVSNLKSN
jgi:hypothetical protein